MKKTSISLIIILSFVMSFLLLPLGSGALTTADSIGSVGVLLITFLFGLSLGGIGLYFMSKKEDNLKFYSGFMLLGFGFIIILVSVNMTISITNEMAFTGLTSGVERVVGISSRLIQVLSYLTLIIMLVLMINAFIGKRKEAKESDGWDSNNY